MLKTCYDMRSSFYRALGRRRDMKHQRTHVLHVSHLSFMTFVSVNVNEKNMFFVFTFISLKKKEQAKRGHLIDEPLDTLKF